MPLFLPLTALLIVHVSGELFIKQINSNTFENWPIRGVATYEYGGINPEVFVFQCTTDSNNDDSVLFYTRKDMAAIPYTQAEITNGVQIEVNPPIAADAGIYICKETSQDSSDTLEFLLTDSNPTTLAAVDSVTHYVGDTVVIDMYASTLTPLTDDIISWEFNDTLITNGTFSNSQTTLTIENVQLSDAGVYTIIVVISGGQCSSSSTTLHILAIEPPVYSFSEEQYNVNEGYRFVAVANVSANPDVMDNDVVWRKDNTVLSHTSNIQCNATTLTIMSASRDDAGNYSITGTNSIGMGSASFYLIVFFGPQFTSNGGPISVSVGDPLVIDCTTGDSNPAVLYVNISGTDLPLTPLSEGNRLYTVIDSVTTEYNGRNYTCTASNGESMGTIMYTVNVSTSVTPNDTSTTRTSVLHTSTTSSLTSSSIPTTANSLLSSIPTETVDINISDLSSISIGGIVAGVIIVCVICLIIVIIVIIAVVKIFVCKNKKEKA